MVKYAFQIEDILKIFKTGEIIYIYITHDPFTTNHWDTSFGVLRESLFTLQPEMLLYIYNCRDSKCQTMADF